ncbi:MAG: hypothetical protein RLN81_06185 [Balneolaceae bacterium]
MRAELSILVTFFIILTSCKSSEITSSVKEEVIFRYAQINPNDSLILGEAITPFAIYGTTTQENALKIGMSYPGVESVTSHFDIDSSITDMIFSYQFTYDFQKQLKEYTEELGKPTFSNDIESEVYLWEDFKTRFQLIKTFGGSDTLMYSILSDKESSFISGISYASLKNYRVKPTIHDVLTFTKIWSIIGGVDIGLKARLKQTSDSTNLILINTLIDHHFQDKVLFQYALEYMDQEFDDQMFEELSAWLFSDWSKEIIYKTDSFEPELSLEEYASSLEKEVPPQDRLIAMYRFVEANKAGEFFFKIEDATNVIISKLNAIVENTDLNYISPTSAERMQQISNYNLGTLVSFLWRMQPITIDQINQNTEAYTSTSGKLYVDSYSDAIVHALKKAGDKVLAELTKAY